MRNAAAGGEATPQGKTFTAPVSSFLGFLPDEQVIQAISVGDEVHALAELRAYELGPQVRGDIGEMHREIWGRYGELRAYELGPQVKGDIGEI